MISAHTGLIPTMTSENGSWCKNPFDPEAANPRPMATASSSAVAASGSQMFIVPIVPNTVTASPVMPRRSANGAHGERSSHSPNTMPATRPGFPHTH